MKVTTATITPEKAARLLGQNTKNRTLNEATVDVYAQAIKRGEWKLNGEAIKIAKNGRLLDGQHRLKAVIKANTPITTYIIEDLEDDAFDTIDIGRTRRASDVLSIAGETNVRALAAAARAVVMLRKQDVLKRVTPSQCAQVLVDMPELRFWVHRYVALTKLRNLIPCSIAAVAALFARIHGTAVVEEFLEQVNDGTRLSPGSPALVLRERFIDRPRGHAFHSDMVMAFCIKALNAHISGKKLGVLRLSANESFPEIIGDARKDK